jgi:uncharacterized protein (DUF1778 family)
MKKPRPGRPRKPKGEKYATPAMQIGRVPVEQQAILRAAARRAGKTFTAWAVEILLREAEKRSAV